MNMNERKAREEMIRIARLMYQKGLIAASDGNLSVKIGEDTLLTTPSGLSKGLLEEDDLVVTDMKGKRLRGRYNPSSELRMHLKVYELRPDVNACVHAHPPISTAFSVAGLKLSEAILPETVFILGDIKFVEYTTPTTEDVPKAIEHCIRDHDALVLTRHGSLTVGKSLSDAYLKLESLEHSAHIISEAIQLARGPIAPLPEAEVERLWKIHEKIAGKSKARKHGESAPETKSLPEGLLEKIVEEVVRTLNAKG